MTHKKMLMVVIAAMGLAACSSGPKYNWGNYQETLHDYYADPAGGPAYAADLDGILAAESKGKKVPPGIYAEAGYMALSQGDTQRAVDLFTREKNAWPESATFMEKAIQNARGDAGKAPVSASLPAPVS